MTISTIRIVTRESPLAMWQANFVRQALTDRYPALNIEILGITTEADRLLDTSLESLGGKGAFVKELEQALLNGSADLAVHSMKDVTVNLPEGLAVPVVLAREDARDVMISRQYSCFRDLPPAARVGTSSLRRCCQLMALRADLNISDIRGNLGTRLQKLDDGRFDALILAAAGVKRLGLQAQISEYFPTQTLLPAVSQGVLGLEVRSDNAELQALLESLCDPQTLACVTAERALNRRLGGDCHVPIAAYAEITGSRLTLSSLVGRLDGSEIIRCQDHGPQAEAEHIGDRLGRQLLEQGAGRILQELDTRNDS